MADRTLEPGMQSGILLLRLAGHQTKSYFIQTIPDGLRELVRPEWFGGVGTVGITAGASTPDAEIDAAVEVVRRLAAG